MKKNFHRVLLARLLRSLDRAADTLGFFNQPLQPEVLIRLAQQSTGLSDLGNWSVLEPLAVLVKAYREEAELTALGRMAAVWDIVRFLSNLLKLRAEEKNEPSILDEEITQPIFILGLPRSGTTFLHNLLAQDPANLAPRCWQTIYPCPLEPGPRTKPDLRPQMVARQFARFLSIAPELPSLHPLEAKGPRNASRDHRTSYPQPALKRLITYPHMNVGSRPPGMVKPIAFISVSCNTSSTRMVADNGFSKAQTMSLRWKRCSTFILMRGLSSCTATH